MSYGFGMIFFEVKSKLEAFEKAEQFAVELLIPETAKKLISNNIRFFRNTLSCKTTDEVEQTIACYLDGWLSQLFTVKCTHWPKHNLLGILGMDWPEKCLALSAGSVYFQNSTDQDYSYNEWPNLPFFLNHIDVYKNIPDSEIIKRWDSSDDDALINEERIGYGRRSLLYQQVYDDLAIENWLYGSHSESFHRFAISAVSNSDDSMKLYSRAKHILLSGMQKGAEQ